MFKRLIALLGVLTASVALARQESPLPSWNAGPARTAITDFVTRVTTPGGKDFVKPEDRIAVFDNDGTLWAEQPMYFQGMFAFDRIKALAPQHPEWKDKEPFKSVLTNDMKGIAAAGEKGLAEIIAVTHSGMTTDEFEAIVKDWLKTARHPTLHKPYTECVYQPMLEVLTYLRANGFKTFIVSGGGVEFMRAFAEQVYGVPPEQVVGSSGKVKFEVRDSTPVLVKLPEIEFIDDGPGKPVGINRLIGKRPIIAFGNSDGDFQMLQWTTSDPGARLGLLVHHTDKEREFAYDRDSHIGKLVRGLDEGPRLGWIIVDMKNDWNVIWPKTK